MPPDFQNSKSRVDVRLFEDSIYFCSYDHSLNPKSAEVWLMKKYGVEGSWTEILVMDFNIRYCYSRDVQVIDFLENRNVLLEDGKFITLFLHNERKGLVKKDKGRTEFFNSAFVNKPGFASLEDVVGDGLKVLKGFKWDRRKP